MTLTTHQPAVSTTTETDGLLDQIMDRMQQVVTRATPPVQPMELRSFDELERWAERAARSAMVPPSFKGKPDELMLAVQLGSELGLRPMQAIQNIAVINNRPAVWGDAMLALCMTHPLYRGVQETFEGEGDDRAAVCVARRQGDAAKVGRFSVADAKRAGLWNKGGPWTQYPDRMLQMRARGFALRDAFADKLRGLVTAEEAQDFSLDAAGITPAMSAAPPIPDAPPAERSKAEQRADAIAARFAAVVTEGDYYTALDADGEALKWLQANRPALWEAPEAARKAASERMTPAAAAEAGA